MLNSKKGFTLLELLVVIVIIGILSSIALPRYMRSIERARATEAQNMVKAINDAVYAYAAEKGTCPTMFSKLTITVPGTTTGSTEVQTKDFSYKLNAASAFRIPGTVCGGTVATRKDTSTAYQIWNPYTVTSGSKRLMACTATTSAGQAACKAMGIFSTKAPNGSSVLVSSSSAGSYESAGPYEGNLERNDAGLEARP